MLRGGSIFSSLNSCLTVAISTYVTEIMRRLWSTFFHNVWIHLTFQKNLRDQGKPCLISLEIFKLNRKTTKTCLNAKNINAGEGRQKMIKCRNSFVCMGDFLAYLFEPGRPFLSKVFISITPITHYAFSPH